MKTPQLLYIYLDESEVTNLTKNEGANNQDIDMFLVGLEKHTKRSNYTLILTNATLFIPCRWTHE